MIRVIAFLLLAAGGVMLAAPAHAQRPRYEGPWCMHMTAGRGTVISRCDMRSYEMCRAEMGGLGGSYCTQNPYYRGPVQGQWGERRSERPTRGRAREREER